MAKAFLRHQGKVHNLEGSIFSIGRDPACDVCVNDQELSRKHALIFTTADGYLLLDFKSSNGIYVNEQKVEYVSLRNGDVIRMGAQSFDVVWEQDKDQAGQAAKPLESHTSFHTMVDLERHLREDASVVLERGKKKESTKDGDAFDKLVILVQVAKAINSKLDMHEVLNEVMDLALKVITADRGFIMLHNEEGQLVPTVQRQMENMLASDGPMTVSRNIVDACCKSREAVLTQDALVDQRFQTSGSIQMYNIRSAMCVPLLSKKSDLLGVLYLDNRIQSHCFEEDDKSLLQAFADQASIAIENARLYSRVTEESRKRTNLSRYLSPEIVERVMTEKSSPLLGGEKVEATILFSDIRGFTTFSESRGSQEVIKVLNEYLSSMTRIIFNYNGTLDKYIGDAIMAIFGAPFKPAYAPARAVMAALHMQREMKELHKHWAEHGFPPLEIGIGINTGEVTAGNIGFSDENEARSRLDFTVIGDAVNTAARLESIAPGGSVLITEGTYQKVADRFEVEPLGEKMVKGKQNAVRVYRVIGVKQG